MRQRPDRRQSSSHVPADHLTRSLISTSEFVRQALLPPDASGRAYVRSLAQTVACEIHRLNNLRVLSFWGAADIGIDTFAAAERNLHRHLLFKEALVAAFPVSPRFVRKRSVRWADLAHERVMALRRGSVSRDLADAGFVTAGLTLTPAFEADHVGTLLGMVDAGLGVARSRATSAEVSNVVT